MSTCLRHWLTLTLTLHTMTPKMPLCANFVMLNRTLYEEQQQPLYKYPNQKSSYLLFFKNDGKLFTFDWGKIYILKQAQCWSNMIFPGRKNKDLCMMNLSIKSIWHVRQDSSTCTDYGVFIMSSCRFHVCKKSRLMLKCCPIYPISPSHLVTLSASLIELVYKQKYIGNLPKSKNIHVDGKAYIFFP